MLPSETGRGGSFARFIFGKTRSQQEMYQMQTCISRRTNLMVHCPQDGTLPCRCMFVSSFDDAA
jgi:hypothetical protein